eukprot:CAMPEP_0183344858 /NCGR_PEP_ID=MMETSP0164_2-20130417/10436_1 /TAXON_ID=221442 /ORGANISM="Coccolithus pelagicus ssp braarudi, Strain PLY182g" /LENGTH=89 /DNA_ID=CAMNT_0025515929 /DNA_START=30 /DNA_END=299 /DNA_ORIENTATION=-
MAFSHCFYSSPASDMVSRRSRSAAAATSTAMPLSINTSKATCAKPLVCASKLEVDPRALSHSTSCFTSSFVHLSAVADSNFATHSSSHD